MRDKTWTHEELAGVTDLVHDKLARVEEDYVDIKGLPAMATDECLTFLHALVHKAGLQPLTKNEQFLCGQLFQQL